MSPVSVTHFNSSVTHFNASVTHFNSPVTHFNSTVAHFNATLSRAGVAISPRAVRPLIGDDAFTVVAFVLLVAGLVISAFAMASNGINVRTFLKMGVEDGVTSLFLAISCSDFAYAVAASVRNASAVIYTVEKGTGRWVVTLDPRVTGIFADNFTYVMYSTTTLLSTFLAVARCACVARPLHFRHAFTRRRCAAASLLCFLFPLACEAAVMANMGTARYLDAQTNASRVGLWTSGDRERVKDVTRFMTNFVLPLAAQVVAIACVSVMIAKLREAARFRKGVKAEVDDDAAAKGDTAAKLTGKDRQAVKQVVVILLIFIVVNVQRIVESFLELYDPRVELGGAYLNLQLTVNHLGIVCQALNAALNIFVYYSYHSKFRALCFSR